MKDILFVLNITKNPAEQRHLISQTNSYLEKHFNYFEIYEFINRFYPHNIYHNDFEDLHGSTYIYFDIMRVVNNYKTNQDLLHNIPHNDNLYIVQKQAEKLEKYDLYCFSIYQGFLLMQLVMALTILRKNPKAHILFGGPEIILNDPIRELCNRLGISTSVGDVETSVYRALTEDFKLDYTSYLDMKSLTYKDVPKYSEEGLKETDYEIFVNSSRGCLNNCYFCCSPALSNYQVMSRDVLINWIKYYNDIGVKKLFFNESNINIYQFEYFLDQLSKINHNLLLKSEMEFYHLNEDIIDKMNDVNFKFVRLGFECFHPKLQKNINKKTINIDKILGLVYKMNNYNFDILLHYIYGLPTQTKDIFLEEFKILKIMSKINKVSPHKYGLSQKSYMYKYPEKFNITIKYGLKDYTKDYPHYADIFEKIYTNWDYPEKKCLREYKEILETIDIIHDDLNIRL